MPEIPRDGGAPKAASASPAPAGKGVVFLRRLGSSAALWGVVLVAIFSPNETLRLAAFFLIATFFSTAGLVEFYDMARHRGLPCYKGWGVVGGLLLTIGTFLYLAGLTTPSATAIQANDFETPFLILFVLGLCARQFLNHDNSQAMAGMAVTLFGLMYVPWLFNFVQKIQFYPGVEGRYYVLYFILVTKFSDLGAYVTGSLIGKHKMIPRVSPGKTWEGFAGAVAISTGVSLLFAWGMGGRLAGLTLGHAAALGVILSLAAVLGDLIESILKREAGVKDSGRLFPGIGGILDLLDSLLFNAPLMYLYLRFVIQP